MHSEKHFENNASKMSNLIDVRVNGTEYEQKFGLKADLDYNLEVTRLEYSFWNGGKVKFKFSRKIVRNFGIRYYNMYCLIIVLDSPDQLTSYYAMH